MKTEIAILTSLAVLGLSTPSASAGDREWATAGKVLTGVVAGAALIKAFEPVPVYHTTAYSSVPLVQAPPPVLVQPPPVVVQPAPVVVQPGPVVVYAQPVRVQPAAVYVQPGPVYVAPRPVVRFSFGFGGHHHHHHGPPIIRVWR
ncbi:MAG: hypothetical protein HY735_16245 [Verrucomicrobia bacterium]|nr:hypothetical protein [Verrucomicrobiota bacterium]